MGEYNTYYYLLKHDQFGAFASAIESLVRYNLHNERNIFLHNCTPWNVFDQTMR